MGKALLCCVQVTHAAGARSHFDVSLSQPLIEAALHGGEGTSISSSARCSALMARPGMAYPASKGVMLSGQGSSAFGVIRILLGRAGFAHGLGHLRRICCRPLACASSLSTTAPSGSWSERRGHRARQTWTASEAPTMATHIAVVKRQKVSTNLKVSRVCLVCLQHFIGWGKRNEKDVAVPANCHNSIERIRIEATSDDQAMKS